MKNNNLGLCCHFLESNDKNTGYKNILCLKQLQFNRYKEQKYSQEYIKNTYTHNLQLLFRTLPNVFKQYKVFRFPCNIFPLFDQVDEQLWNNEQNVKLLQQIGSLIKDNSVRATFHPGQFCSLSSPDEYIRLKSAQEINHRGWIFDQMQLDQTPFYAINIHGGKKGCSQQLIHSIDMLLTQSSRLRLTLENDESCYSVCDLLEVYKSTNVPVVLDSHHHTFNDNGLSIDDVYAAVLLTWGKIKPKQHISNSCVGSENKNFIERRKHSDYIHTIPNCQLKGILNNEIDLMCEAKLKNITIAKIIKDYME